MQWFHDEGEFKKKVHHSITAYLTDVCVNILSQGGVYKPRGKTGGEGGWVAQMTTTLNNSYLVKVST